MMDVEELPMFKELVHGKQISEILPWKSWKGFYFSATTVFG